MPQIAAQGDSSNPMREVPTQALIALGANIPSRVGSPAETLLTALYRLEKMPLKIDRASHLYATPCFPKGSGPDYVNAAVAVSVMTEPHGFLKSLNAMEIEFGRQRDTRWGRRTLDLDLIAFGDLVLPDARTHRSWQNLSAKLQQIQAPDELILPHPRLQDRAFVLVPLLEIAPEWRHPVSGLTVEQMHAALPDDEKAAIRVLRKYDETPISLAKHQVTD